MNCRQVKREMALLVGHDGQERRLIGEVRRHVLDCPGCRAHLHRLKQAMEALEHSDQAATYDVRQSIWPELRSRLDRPAARLGQRSLKPWLPMISVTVACLLLVMFWNGGGAPTAPQEAGQVQFRQVMPLLPGFPTLPPQHVPASVRFSATNRPADVSRHVEELRRDLNLLPPASGPESAGDR